MVALHGNKISHVALTDALEIPKRVDIHGDTVNSARSVGISMGE
jgi:hypothetical protein